MIVVHNNRDPKEVSPLINSTIVESDGENPTDYKAYSVKSTVTWPDPAAYNESQTLGVNNLRDARNDVVNHAKVPDIAIGTPSSTLLKYVSKSGETNLLITSPFGNWREYSTNGFCSISERVLLNPEALIMKNGVTYTVDNMKSLLSGTSDSNGHTLSGMLKGITSLVNAVGDVANVEAAEKGEYISKFQNVPVTDPSKVVTSGLDSLKFTFKFGQAQLFSAEEEVVKPILAIANIFMPRQNKSSNRITTPFMTQIRAKTHIMAACLGTLGSNFKDLLGDITSTPTGESIRDNGISFNHGSGGFANNVVGLANDITSKVFEGIDNAAKKALDETVTILLNIGGYVTGPYVATQVNWDFDFNDVDEYGYPCKGEITLGGLKMIFVNCADDALRQWGYNTSGTGDNPFAGKSTLGNTAGVAYSGGDVMVGAKTGNTQGAIG